MSRDLQRGLARDRQGPALARRHHQQPDAEVLPISGGGDGLGDAECPALAALQQHGEGLCIPGPGEGQGPLRARPQIFNNDQGGHFISPRFVDVLKDAGVRGARWPTAAVC